MSATPAKVTKVSQAGLAVQLPDGSEGIVPSPEIFLGDASPVFLIDLVYSQTTSISVRDTIRVLPLDGQGRFSRKAAVRAALSRCKEGDHVYATISEIRSEAVYATADDGFSVYFPAADTFARLEEIFGKPRLCPGPEFASSEDTTREESLLFIGDRVKVKLGKLTEDSLFAAQMMIRGKSPLTAAPNASGLPAGNPVAPRSDYDEILIVESNLDEAERLNDYFERGGYYTTWAIDFDEVQRWYDDLAARVHKAPKDNLPSLVAVVRADAQRLAWRELCQYLGRGTTACDIILSLTEFTEQAAALKRAFKELQIGDRLRGIWHRAEGYEALGPILTAKSVQSKGFEPSDSGIGLTTPAKPSSRDPALKGLIRYRTRDEDIGAALALLVAAAKHRTERCAAMLFRIHKRSHSVKLLVANGDPGIISGFREYEPHLYKSPVRDLAIYRQQSDTDNADGQRSKFIYFLDAVGGPGSPLSALGIRPTAPSRSPFAYAVFLVAPTIAAFHQNPHLSKTLRQSVRGFIETSLTAKWLDSEAVKLRRMAENAFDFAFMAHEAVDNLELPANQLLQIDPGAGLDSDQTDEVRRGVLRAWAVMNQIFPEKKKTGLENQYFQPVEMIEELFEICSKVVGSRSIDMKCNSAFPRETVFLGRQFAFDTVLRNLILNAAQQIQEYCKGKGLVRVELAADHQPTGATMLTATVSDNGPGIHGKYWKSIFEPGVSTRSEGTGFGLAVSQRLIRAARGSLDLTESLLYSGTNFRVTMPVQE